MFIANFNRYYSFFSSSSTVQIPFTLSVRNHNTYELAILGLSISFILLATVRWTSSNLILTFGKVITKNNTLSKTLKEEYSLMSLASLFLILNYFLTSFILLYLSNIHLNISKEEPFIIGLSIMPIYFFVWPITCFYIIGKITNEYNLLKENQQNNVVLTQILGVIFSILLLVWTFNIKWSEYFMLTFIFIIIAFWIFKTIRGIFFSIQNAIPWYYIILYFCTLEILPIMLIFSINFRENKSIWLNV